MCSPTWLRCCHCCKILHNEEYLYLHFLVGLTLLRQWKLPTWALKRECCALAPRAIVLSFVFDAAFANALHISPCHAMQATDLARP